MLALVSICHEVTDIEANLLPYNFKNKTESFEYSFFLLSMTARTVIKNSVGLKIKKEKPAKTFEKNLEHNFCTVSNQFSWGISSFILFIERKQWDKDVME